ncbi:hypothetical protein ES703_115207 [subsurface metagenome]
MADYYYATVTYHSGDKVRVVHKGREPTKATRKVLGRMGATFELGEPVPQEKAEQIERTFAAIAAEHRLRWHPQMDIPEVD